MSDVDVIVVGASVAGSTTAALLAQQGARVALLEKSPDPAHYKKLCTHELIALAVPVLERLGVLDQVTEIAGDHGASQQWTRWGWISPPVADAAEIDGLNIRREKLDPLLREAAAAQPGVELMQGVAVHQLLRDDAGRPCGVRARHLDGTEVQITARVVVGADGAGSTVAGLAGLEPEQRPHERFGYAGYFEGVPDVVDRAGRRASRIWWMDPDVAYAFPTDSGLTLLAIAPTRTEERRARFKGDIDGAFREAFAAVPDGPDLSQARQVGQFQGLLQGTNLRRPGAAPGVALVGDAAQVADYVWGTGCGFAIASGAWLADSVGPALAAGASDRKVDAALRRYARAHRRRLAPHYEQITSYSTGRRMSAPERLLWGTAAHDDRVAEAFNALAGRTRHPLRVLTPAVFARLVAGRLRRGGQPAGSAHPSAV